MKLKTPAFNHKRLFTLKCELIKVIANTPSIQYLVFKGETLNILLYNSENIRNYNDIDILLEFHDIQNFSEKANLEIINHALRYKINLVQSLSHDYAAIEEKTNTHFELHWRFFSNRFLFPVKFDELYTRSQIIEIAGRKVRTFSNNDYALYLAVHGAVHRWFRLMWLYDYKTLIENLDIEWDWVIEQAKTHKLSNALIQAHKLVEHYFGIAIPHEVADLYAPKKHDYFIHEAQRAINLSAERVNSRGFEKVRFTFYMMRLKPNFRFWVESLWRLRTHPGDWELIKLPEKLFFMYYLLRPFILVCRALKIC